MGYKQVDYKYKIFNDSECTLALDIIASLAKTVYYTAEMRRCFASADTSLRFMARNFCIYLCLSLCVLNPPILEESLAILTRYLLQLAISISFGLRDKYIPSHHANIVAKIASTTAAPPTVTSAAPPVKDMMVAVLVADIAADVPEGEVFVLFDVIDAFSAIAAI